MSLNFNVDPYYDDFDPTKNFHRIVFKPGYAVQARELTQSQTILQNQISNFADNIFSQNTPVKGGKVTTNLNCYYLRLNTQTSGVNVVASNFLNSTITDSTGTIIAKVVATAEGVPNGDPPTLIVTYISGSHFSDGQTITNGTNLATISPSTVSQPSTGLSSVASISSGIFYVINGYSQSSTQNADGSYTKYSIGNFVQVNPQTIILDKYDNTPSYRVGLQISETIVTSDSDTSLLDPAIGASNYQAPGADRYQINLTLITLPLAVGGDDSFIELVRVENGSIVKQTNDTVYSVIDDYFAKRDYETNGDYIVEDFKIVPTKFQNALNPSQYKLNVGKGVAYVRGYRIENQSQVSLIANRARTTDTVGTNSILVDYGSYFVVDTVGGVFDFTTMPTVDLHCVTAANIVSSNATTYNSTLVGTGFIRGLRYQSSNGSNTQSYVFNSHVNDISTKQLSGNAASATATSITFFDLTGKFSSSANAYINCTLAITSGTDSGDVRTISSYNVATKTATVSSPFTVTPDSTSNFSLNFKTTNINSIVQKNASYALTANSNINVNTGKLPAIGTGLTQYYNTGTPEMIFQLGYPYVANVANSVYSSTLIYRNQGFSAVGNTLTISTSSPIAFQGTVGATYTGETFKQLFTLYNAATGQILDFSAANSTAYITDSTHVTFTSPLYGSVSNVTVVAAVTITNGDAVGSSAVYKTKSYITGNTTYGSTSLSGISGVSNTTIDLAKGQTYIQSSAISTNSAISLYVTDVVSIAKIIDVGTGVSPSGNSLGSYTDVTSSFTLDNGQRDNFYDHATITLRPGLPAPKGNILVCYNYYSHSSSGDGYFNVNSYPGSQYANIPSYTAKDGYIYNLRDCVDFRPSRQNGQQLYVWEYKTPAAANYGALLPQNLTSYVNNYSYYLGRKDKLILTKDSQFSIVQGTPSINPQFPIEPDGSLVLANISLDPYTAIIPGEESTAAFNNPANISINKVLHKRWAKSDITNLQTQVDNLEYYTSLSVLEQNANSLQVPDVNGLNRFKNGILVDDFSSFGTAQTASTDFSANINIRKNQLSPITDVVNFQLQNPQVIASLGTLANTNSFAINSIGGTVTNIFTLPYTTANVITQQLASNTISVNPFNVVSYQGIAALNPPMDNWYNTVMPPAITITDPSLQFNQVYGGINTLHAGDYASVPGTTSLLTATQLQTQQTYISELTGLNNAELSTAASSALSSTNGFITNNAVAPYIRPQEVIVRAKGMLVNTPVSCWFDGRNVNQYMIGSNTIEVTGVTGTFNEDDVIGFYINSLSKFFPIARIVSIYYYPDTTKVRLYVAKLTNIPTTTTSTTLTNAFFDVNGNYTGKTASGTVVFNNLINIHTSGGVTGVGGGYTNANTASPTNIYKTQYISDYTAAQNQYMVWGDPNNGSTYSATYPVTLPAGTYTISAWSTGSASVSLDTTTITPSGGTSTATGSYTSTGGNKTLSWTANKGSYNMAGIGVKITNASGTVVWNSLTPTNLNFSAIGSEYQMPLGGSLYVGTSKINLDQNASSANGYYIGATVQVKATYVYSYNYGAVYIPPAPGFSGDGDAANVNAYYQRVSQYNSTVAQIQASAGAIIYLAATDWYTANVTSYNGVTRTATLDASVNVSMGYNTQYGSLNSEYFLSGTVANVASAITTSTFPALSTDESGQFVGIFSIPGSDFFAGERVFRIDNRTVLTDPTSATTFAEATFHATGLLTNSQTSNFGPSVDSSSSLISPLNQQSYNIVSHSSPYDPIAQTFIVSKDNYPNGIFISSIKVFFATKSNTAPVTLSVVGTLNGYPNGQTLDYSTVTLSSNQVKTSFAPHYLDSTSYTEFVFNAPVYIQAGVLYAFVLTSSSADYTLYYGQQNQTAIPSTAISIPVSQGGVLPTNPTKIGAAPYVGALFESQNAITWTADQSKDLMFVINQCVFNTAITPTINFVTPKGLPFRKLGRNDIQYNLDSNSVNGLIGCQFSPSRPMDAFSVTTTDFVPSVTNIAYKYNTTLLNNLAQTSNYSVTPGKFGAPPQENVYLNDGQGERVLLNSSNNSFQLSATLTSTDPNVSPIISDDGVSLYSLIYYINNIGIDTSCISIANSGTGYGPNTTITVSSPDIGSDKAVLGFTTNTSTNAISSIYVTYPGSGYLTTPTITVTDPTTRSGNANASIVVYGETSPIGGNAYAKYITKPVVLTAAAASGDLRVYYTAYKPVGTNIYVYYKILNGSDTTSINAQNWQLMTQVGGLNTYSTDRTNLIEFSSAPGINNQANNNISYTSINGQTYTNFTQFQIKVVMTTNDRTNVPFLKNIRALALPSGTGL